MHNVRGMAFVLSTTLLVACWGAVLNAQGSHEAANALDGSVDETLSLLDAVRRAHAHYPAVSTSAAQREAAEALLAQARAGRLPTLDVGLTANRYQRPTLATPIRAFTPGETPPFDRTLVQTWTNLSYVLFDGGARAGRIERARELSASADHRVDDARQSVTAAVVATYLDTLSRRGVLEARERQLAALEAERNRLRQLMEVDRAAEVDQLRVEAALASAEADRVQAAAALEVSRRELSRLIGADAREVTPERLVSLSYTGPNPASRDELATAMLADNPRILSARREAAAADAGVSVARSGRRPPIELAGTYIDRASSEGRLDGEWYIGVRLTFPLFTGDRIGQEIAEAEARRRAELENVRLEEIQAAGHLDRAVSAVEEAQARVSSLMTAVRGYEEVARIEQLRLDTGIGTQSDYLIAESDLAEARSGLVEARHGELAALAELARVMGQLDPVWISENLEPVR